MGRWVKNYNAPLLRTVFWENYVIGIFIPFISFAGPYLTKYFYEKKDKAKWLGFICGAATFFPVYGSIWCIIESNWICLIILILLVMPIVIVGTVHIYKTFIRPWALEEDRSLFINGTLPSLIQSRLLRKMTNEEIISSLESYKNKGVITYEEFIAYKMLIEME